MISTHVLDTARGAPAVSLAVALHVREGDAWRAIAQRTTDTDGRVRSFSDAALAAGVYRLTFDTAPYHRAHGVTPFFAEVAVTFEVHTGGTYHVPVLLSPFGYSTYRGT